MAAVVKQPKRLAVVAYLAAASPHRFHRRDTLLALFWPELDDAHARSALRRALYFLRGELGSGAVVGRGDEVATAPDVLWCDVLAFREALDTGGLIDALDLYRGDLLEGLFVPSAPEFERWLESERGQLRTRAAGAAWKLAGEAERVGDRAETVRWAQRAAAFTPDDEGATQRLIALLDQEGDRAAALQAYETFARRLADEYDLQPSPETRTLIDAVRARGAPAATPPSATGEPAAPPLPNLIAVLPFTVRGDEGLRYLREGTVDLLSAKLDRAGDVGTVDPRALLRYVQFLGAGDIDPQLARTVATHFSAGLFILGSIVAVGGALHVAATMYDTTGQAREVRADVAADGEAGIMEAVDALVRQLIAQRPASLGGRMARLAAVATDSLPALKEYLVGERAFRAGRYAEAMGAYQSAVNEDPTFALGHYRLAATYSACGMLEAAREPSARAWEHRDRLNVHTKLLLEAQAAWLGGDASSAEGLYTRIVTTSPDDVEAWFLLGDTTFNSNPYRGRSIVEARQPLERALALDPKHIGALSHLVKLAALERRYEDLDELFHRFTRVHGTTDPALSLRALHALALRDRNARERVTADLEAAVGVTVAHALGDVALYVGDLEEAYRLAQAVTSRAQSPGLRGQLRLMLAHLAFARQDPEAGIEQLARAATADRAAAIEHRAFLLALPFIDASGDQLDDVRKVLVEWEPPTADRSRDEPLALTAHDGIHLHLRSYLLGLIVARAGACDAALGYAEECERLGAPVEKQTAVADLAKGVRALVAVHRDEPAHALEILDTLSPKLCSHHAAVSPFCGLAAERFLRAEALVAVGRGEDAVGWLEGLGQLSPYELVFRAPAQERLSAIRDANGGDR